MMDGIVLLKIYLAVTYGIGIHEFIATDVHSFFNKNKQLFLRLQSIKINPLTFMKIFFVIAWLFSPVTVPISVILQMRDGEL